MDVAAIRRQFPALHREVNGRPLVYLDSASTAQKPQVVIDATVEAYLATANIHRGVHTLSVEATAAYESVRAEAAALLNGTPEEIVFTRGTTEALNLLASTLSRTRLGPGDTVVVTELEHHSNLVPWQLACQATGASLSILPIDESGQVRLDDVDRHFTPRTRILAVSHASNSLGTVVPVAELARHAHRVGAVVVVDGAQGITHGPVDVHDLGCDFYVFSGHKLYGPTGTGVLWGREALLASLPPWQAGGDMVNEVFLHHATWRDSPHRFEAGTPNIVGIIGLGAALRWFRALDPEQVGRRDAALTRYALEVLGGVEGVRILGAGWPRIGAVSFLLGGHHPHDVGTMLDLEGIAVRTGQHCTQPVMDRLGVAATVRASFGVYTTEAEVDALAEALRRADRLLGGTR